MASKSKIHRKSEKSEGSDTNVKVKASKTKKKHFLSSFFNYLWLFFRFIFLSLFYAFKFIFGLFSKSKNKKPKKSRAVEEESSLGKSNVFRNLPKPNIRVLDSYKGSFKAFMSYVKKSDSFIGIVLGARGSGKSAIALALVENLGSGKKKVFAMGFPSKALPSWIHLIKDVSQIQNDSFLIVDEGGILFSSRSSMSDANKFLSELLFVARHKNLSIIFISQNSSNLEVNTLRQADFLILKRSSLLQKNFERKIVADIYTEYNFGFDMHTNVKGLALIYSDKYVGFIDNDLPSFWSENISKSFK